MRIATPVKSVDPRVRRTRQLLQKAFFTLMQEKGFAAITIQDIAERATVNRATFYAHFEDKYALLDCCIREKFQQILTDTLPTTPGISVKFLRILTTTIFDFLTELHHGHCQSNLRALNHLFERAIQQELYTAVLQQLMQALPAATELPVPAETTATIISWTILGVATQWDGITSTEEITRQVLTVMIHGLKGITQISEE